MLLTIFATVIIPVPSAGVLLLGGALIIVLGVWMIVKRHGK